MIKLPLKEAETKLSELVNRVTDGEEVVLTRDDGVAVAIVPAESRKPRIVETLPLLRPDPFDILRVA
jgi:prevent-host-death family protein